MNRGTHTGETTIFCTLYYGINIPLNFRYNFFVKKIFKFNSNIHIEKQRTQNSQNNLKQNKIGGLTFPYFKAYLQPSVINTVWRWHKDIHIHQWNRTESQKYAQLFLMKVPRKPTSKRIIFPQVCWDKSVFQVKTGTSSYFIPF